MTDITLNDAVSILITAADARMQQWKGVGEGERPDALIDELWESCETGNLEAQAMAEEIECAIEVVQAHYREHDECKHPPGSIGELRPPHSGRFCTECGEILPPTKIGPTDI